MTEVDRLEHATALGIARVRRSDEEVITKGAGEHRRVLLDISDLTTQGGAIERAQVGSVKSNSPRVWIVEALDEAEDRRLTRS